MKQNFWKKHRKLWITLAVLVIVIGGFVLFVRSKVSEAAAMLQNTSVQIGTVETRNLTESITATGTVESLDSEKITSELTGTEIQEIFVEVGDMVKKGDILLQLNTEDIEDNIAKTKTNIANNKASDSLTKQSASRELEYATDVQTQNVSDAEERITDAQTALDDAIAYYDEAKTLLKNAKNTRNGALTDYENASADYNNAKAAYEAKLQDTSNPDVAAYQAELTALKSTYDAANMAMQTAKAAYENALQNVVTYESRVKSTETAKESAQTAYDNAVSSRDSTVKSSENTMQSQQENYSKSTLTLGQQTEELEKQLEKYNKNLEKCTIRAPFDGIITSLDVRAGNTYTNGAMLTVENCQSYTVTAQIDEYDICNLNVGMEVLLKTDSTGDEELTGIITFISPTATVSSGSSITYKITVTVTSATDRLRLGMSARLNIILNEKKDVLTVPYNGIHTDELGNSYIIVIDDPSDTTKQRNVPVEVGMDGDYYVEISSSEVKEGTLILLPGIVSGNNGFGFMMGGGGGRMESVSSVESARF